MLPRKNPHIDTILKNLSSTPGVYQMKDKIGKTIYVGKSMNLKSRVSSYFRESGGLTMAKSQMVSKIVDIEIMLCQNEVEALVLETNLIKHLSPKYNILMKDDKNLAYIKITPGAIPEVIKTRQKMNDGGEYFGPYTQGSNIYDCVKQLKRLFRIRNCKMKFAQKGESSSLEVIYSGGRTIPCMDYYIGICPAPCILEEKNINEHNDNMNHMRQFLSGEHQKTKDELIEKMHSHARKLEFEEAQKIKELLDSIGHITEKQIARDLIEGDHDIFVKLEKYEKLYVGILQIRDGHMVGFFRHTLENLLDTYDDGIAQFLARQYVPEGGKTPENIPESIILAQPIHDNALLSFFQEYNILLTLPKIGGKKELLDFAQNQLREYAYKSELSTLEQKTLTRTHMENVLQKLGYAHPKKGAILFECYDISHTHGHFTYASRVLISDGKPDTARYKKYTIKTLQAGEIDDFASHKEVMMRRIIEAMEYGNLPHLIIIDGGKGQLSSALAGLREGLYVYFSAKNESPEDMYKHIEETLLAIPICSIAKREEEIFLPGKKTPVIFDTGTPELMVLQKARDESHRFSITANRKARMKSMKKNILEELPGFGPITRKNLLKIAGSVDNIRHVSESELKTLCNHTQIETLKDHGLID